MSHDSPSKECKKAKLRSRCCRDSKIKSEKGLKNSTWCVLKNRKEKQVRSSRSRVYRRNLWRCVNNRKSRFTNDLNTFLPNERKTVRTYWKIRNQQMTRSSLRKCQRVDRKKQRIWLKECSKEVKSHQHIKTQKSTHWNRSRTSVTHLDLRKRPKRYWRESRNQDWMLKVLRIPSSKCSGHRA